LPAGHKFDAGGVDIALQLNKPCAADAGSKQVECSVFVWVVYWLAWFDCTRVSRVKLTCAHVNARLQVPMKLLTNGQWQAQPTVSNIKVDARLAS